MSALKTSDVAERFNVDDNKVRFWIKSGQLKAFDVSERPGIGKPRYRVTLEEVERFERSRTQTPVGRRQRRSKVKRVYT